MASEVVAVNHEELQQCKQQFEQEQARCQRVFNMISSQMQVLRGGAWVAPAADAFYREMDDEVMVSMNRLIQALGKSADVCNQIGQIFEAAEEEASSFLPSDF